jgi:predicted MFS family arabinose efflux permease
MIPPVTLPAVVAYYLTKNPDGSRNVDLRVAAWMAVGVLFGSYFGARFANAVPKETLKLIFGFVLVYVACYTVFGREHMARSVALSAVVVLVAVALYAATKVYDRAAAPQANDQTAAEAR